MIQREKRSNARDPPQNDCMEFPFIVGKCLGKDLPLTQAWQREFKRSRAAERRESRKLIGLHLRNIHRWVARFKDHAQNPRRNSKLSDLKGMYILRA